ncbi:MAG: LexA family protein [Holosporales bacterium]
MTRGGKRIGAGRKPGTGPYGEKTIVMRVPESKAETLKSWLRDSFDQAPGIDSILSLENLQKMLLPLYSSRVAAGMPSPADDHMEGRLDLNDYLVRRPEATFLIRVTGDSMIEAGIHPGDLLVVDRSVDAGPNRVVVAVLDGELTVKRLIHKNGQVILRPENRAYQDIVVPEGSDFMIWGVVCHVIHSV